MVPIADPPPLPNPVMRAEELDRAFRDVGTVGTSPLGLSAIRYLQGGVESGDGSGKGGGGGGDGMV
jgi:hypothetical protein